MDKLVPAPAEVPSCVNCGHEVTTSFCSQCGQRQHVPRLKLNSLIGEAFGRLLGLDTRFLRTVIDLTLRPHRLIEAVWQGNRVRYLGPITYYFLMFSLYLLVANLLGISFEDIIGSTGVELDGSSQGKNFDGEALKKEFLDIFSNYLQFFTLFMFPFMAWWGMLFFRKARKNFVEHIVFAFYANSHPYWLGILGFCLHAITGEMYTLLSIFPSYLYYVVVGVVLFPAKNKFVGTLKMIMVVFFGYFSYMFFFTLVLVAWLIIKLVLLA
ncbi:MAG: DUF3667 domain-containing protein [Salibacteraceae bacterium]